MFSATNATPLLHSSLHQLKVDQSLDARGVGHFAQRWVRGGRGRRRGGRGGGKIRVVLHKGEGIAALARPFVHSAVDVRCVPDLEEDRLIAVCRVLGRVGVLCAVRSRRGLEQGGGGLRGGGRHGGGVHQPEDVDVTGLGGDGEGFGEFGQEGRGCVWGESFGDQGEEGDDLRGVVVEWRPVVGFRSFPG